MLPGALTAAILVGLVLLSLRRPSRARVTFDTERVTRIMPGGRSESVRWSDLTQVVILTTADGPAADDVVFMLFGSDPGVGCAVPSETAGMPELLRRLQQLPGFDNAAVARAMGSTAEASFVVWRRGAD